MKFNFLNIKQRYNLKDYKFSLVALVTTISIIGIFVVGSAQASVQGKQIAGVAVSYTHLDVYKRQGAHVIAKDSGNWFSTFTIDKGSNDGIKVDMNLSLIHI